MINFEINLGKIEPMGKPSVRVSKNKGYFPIKYKRYCQWVGMMLGRQWTAYQSSHSCSMLDSAFSARIEFGFKKSKIGKPDLDNLCKSILDLLTTLKIIKDDSLLVDLSAKKVYDDKNRITICLLTN